jgi:hypothetical protein
MHKTRNARALQCRTLAFFAHQITTLFLCTMFAFGHIGTGYLDGFKETMPRDFPVQVYLMNQFPKTPEYPIRAVSNSFRKFATIFSAQSALFNY